jgi:hypothetical protein
LKCGPFQDIRAATKKYLRVFFGPHPTLEVGHESRRVFEIVIAKAFGYRERILQQPHEKMRLPLQ